MFLYCFEIVDNKISHMYLKRNPTGLGVTQERSSGGARARSLPSLEHEPSGGQKKT